MLKKGGVNIAQTNAKAVASEQVSILIALCAINRSIGIKRISVDQ
jgi:hypothetical protein